MKRAFYTTTLSNKFKLLTMSKFLYGAAVQGIQSFIFQTNTLREIVGASELVEEICTKMFAEQLGISITELEKMKMPLSMLPATSNTYLTMRTSVKKSSESFRNEFWKPPQE